MVEFVQERKKRYQAMLDAMPVRERPSYEEENHKVMLKAKKLHRRRERLWGFSMLFQGNTNPPMIQKIKKKLKVG